MRATGGVTQLKHETGKGRQK